MKNKIYSHIRYFIHQFMVLDIFQKASAMAYSTLLSIIPCLAIIFLLLSLFTPVMGKNGMLLPVIQDIILENLAYGAGKQVIDYLDKILGKLQLKNLGMTSFAGFFLAFILLLQQIEVALNEIFSVKKARSLFSRVVKFWTLTTLGTFSLFALMGLASGFEFNLWALVDNIRHDPDYFKLNKFISFSFSFGFFILLYKLVPNCQVNNKAAVISSFVTALCFHVSSFGFILYVKYVAEYKLLYGALFSLPVFLLWIYVAWVIILTGALLCFHWQNFVLQKNKIPKIIDRTPWHKDRIGSLLPLLVYLEIHEYYKKANGALTFEQLQNLFSTHSTSVIMAIDFLKEKKFIYENQENQAYLPTRPPDRIFIEELYKEFLPPVHVTLKTWNHPRGNHYEKWFKIIKENKAQNISLEELMNLSHL